MLLVPVKTEAYVSMVLGLSPVTAAGQHLLEHFAMNPPKKLLSTLVVEETPMKSEMVIAMNVTIMKHVDSMGETVVNPPVKMANIRVVDMCVLMAISYWGTNIIA